MESQFLLVGDVMGRQGFDRNIAQTITLRLCLTPLETMLKCSASKSTQIPPKFKCIVVYNNTQPEFSSETSGAFHNSNDPVILSFIWLIYS